jgi:hypothetical protein
MATGILRTPHPTLWVLGRKVHLYSGKSRLGWIHIQSRSMAMEVAAEALMVR